MVHQWQEFLRKPIVWINFILALLLNIVTWALLFININPQDGLITLHYTLYFGVDKVGSWAETLLIPSAGLLIILINFAFAFYFHERAKIIRNFFLVMTVIAAFLIFLSALLVVTANLPAQI